MKLVEIELTLPDVVKEINEKMKELAKDRYYCIGGGAISNTYMGIPIRDVDVFFDFLADVEEIEKVFGVKTIDVLYQENRTYEDDLRIPFLVKLEYKGMKVELIKTPHMRSTEFDLRFRQFYYFNDKVYATEGALQDIEKKQIVVTNPSTPISTYFRVLRFNEQLGFTITKESLAYIMWSFNVKNVEVAKAIEYVEKRERKISKEIREHLLHFYKENNVDGVVRIEHAPFPYHPSIEVSVVSEVRKFNGTLAVHHEKLETFSGTIDETFTLDLPYKYYQGKMERYVKDIKKMRLKYVFDPAQQEHPFPLISPQNLEREFKEYLSETFSKRLRNVMEQHVLLPNWTIEKVHMMSGIAPLKEKVQVRIFSMQNEGEKIFWLPKYGDVLYHNFLFMEVEIEHERKTKDKTGKMYYLLRKCDNGKYTISDLYNNIPDGAGFYLEVIGKALKDQFPTKFDFENPSLQGIFAFDYHYEDFEYFFNNQYYNRNFLHAKEPLFYHPMMFLKEAVTV